MQQQYKTDEGGVSTEPYVAAIVSPYDRRLPSLQSSVTWFRVEQGGSPAAAAAAAGGAGGAGSGGGAAGGADAAAGGGAGGGSGGSALPGGGSGGVSAGRLTFAAGNNKDALAQVGLCCCLLAGLFVRQLCFVEVCWCVGPCVPHTHFLSHLFVSTLTLCPTNTTGCHPS